MADQNFDITSSIHPDNPSQSEALSIMQHAQFVTHKEELEFLQKLGFPTNPYNQEANNIEEIWKIQDTLHRDRESLSYNIDGLVVKLNNIALTQELGVVGKTPRGWCAVKYAAEEMTTTLIDITWQVGRTGRVTPVAVLEPVELAGTTVKRASLHNYKEVLNVQLRRGDVVVVRKAGDIIPEVVKVLENLRTPYLRERQSIGGPEICPECSTKLTISTTDVDLVCENTEGCPAQILGRLVYYTQRNVANITGLSEKHIERFIKEFGVRDVPDLYDLPFDQIQSLEGFGEKSRKNMEDSVNRARELTPSRFLAGLCIDGVGLEVAKLISQLLARRIQNTTFNEQAPR